MADSYRPPPADLKDLDYLKHYRPEDYVRLVARQAVSRAIKSGRLVKPDVCSRCNVEIPRRSLHAHHADYERPLDVVWLCVRCHFAEHHPVVPPPPKDLTEREMDVWPLIADGATDKQIAGQLGISANTVRVYIVSLAYKLDIPGGKQTRVLIARAWWRRQAPPTEAA